jgi:hypothetical protein
MVANVGVLEEGKVAQCSETSREPTLRFLVLPMGKTRGLR